jgi:AraC family transcriptional regulator
MTDAQHAELIAVVGLAGRTNDLVTAMQIPTDAEFQRLPLRTAERHGFCLNFGANRKSAGSRNSKLRTGNMVQPKTYDNYADFYRRSSYSVFPQQHRVVRGAFRSNMIVVDQDRHELADPAVDELVVSIPLEGGACGYEWNRGCAWISGQSRTGDFIVVPPGVESRWRVGGARKPVILAAPTALVRGMLGSDCPADLSNAFEPISGSSAPDPFVGAALHRLWSLGDSEEPLSRMFVDSVVLAVVWQLLTLARGAASRPADGAFCSRDWRRVCEYIEAHIHEEIVLVDLANAGGWSVRHFSRMFRRSAGQSPHRFILRKRVDRAKNLLRSPRLPLAEIALSCGFADQSHFTTSFRKAMGRTPLRWRHDFA